MRLEKLFNISKAHAKTLSLFLSSSDYISVFLGSEVYKQSKCVRRFWTKQLYKRHSSV